MDGLDKLRTLSGAWDELGLGGALAEIADEIERERAEDCYRMGLDYGTVWRVMLDMERHCLGHEGMEDSPVARWARELRYALRSDASDERGAQNPSWHDPADAADVTSDDPKVTRDPAEDVSMSAYDLLPADEREAIAWVRDHGGLEFVKERLDWVVSHCSTKQQLDFDFWLSGHVMYELGFEEDIADRDEVERRLLDRLMPEGMEWLLEVWPRWSDGEYCKFGDWWKSDKYGVHEPEKFRKLSIYTPEQLDEWGQGDGESYGYEWDFTRPSDPKHRPDKVEPPEPVDTWERLEEDAEKGPCSYFGFDGEEMCGKCPASGKSCEQTMALDIVRRAKALAEREGGE